MEGFMRALREFEERRGYAPSRILMSREQVSSIKKSVAASVRWFPNTVNGPIALAGIPVEIVDPETDLLYAPFPVADF